MRLIDADALKKQIEDFHCKGCDNYNFVRCRACWVDDTLSYLDEAPTIGGWITTWDDECKKYVTHWMPTEPPKEVSEDG